MGNRAKRQQNFLPITASLESEQSSLGLLYPARLVKDTANKHHVPPPWRPITTHPESHFGPEEKVGALWTIVHPVGKKGLEFRKHW
jgi:hypothetical protein